MKASRGLSLILAIVFAGSLSASSSLAYPRFSTAAAQEAALDLSPEPEEIFKTCSMWGCDLDDFSLELVELEVLNSTALILTYTAPTGRGMNFELEDPGVMIAGYTIWDEFVRGPSGPGGNHEDIAYAIFIDATDDIGLLTAIELSVVLSHERAYTADTRAIELPGWRSCTDGYIFMDSMIAPGGSSNWELRVDVECQPIGTGIRGVGSANTGGDIKITTGSATDSNVDTLQPVEDATPPGCEDGTCPFPADLATPTPTS